MRQVETAVGGIWPFWCHSHNLVRALRCTTCTSAVCGECWCDREGAATRWPIPGEWRDWWANRSNLLNELVEEEGKGAAVMFDEQGGPHRAIKKIGDAMRSERGGSRMAPRRRTSPPPRRTSPFLSQHPVNCYHNGH